MRTEDLMLGDYVQNTAGIIGKVIGIKPAEITMQYHDNSTCFSDPKLLEPIPLTPEILEKNEFLESVGYWWHKDFRITIKGANKLTMVCGRVIQFSFVHELQRALRLCGIEKEIVL